MYYPPNSKFANQRHNGQPNNVSARNLSEKFRHVHMYEISPEEMGRIFTRNIYVDVIKSEAFQRLKDIHFLGSIDYVISPKESKRKKKNPIKRHTRYQHSLGVAMLALQYAEERFLSEEQEVLCVVSALLHDIGHAPLSHSLESVFKEEFGVSHHVSGEKIIRGEVEIGKGLNSVLCEGGINPFEVLAIISGHGESPYREIFSYAINIDTIEGILRSSTYINGNMNFITPGKILDALIKAVVGSTRVDDEAISCLDKFWELKGYVYSELINSRLGVTADYICQKYMRDNAELFKGEYYYGYEVNLRVKHPLLFEMLESITIKNSSKDFPKEEKINCYMREFVVNKDVIIGNLKSINERYSQTKSPFIYLIKTKGTENEYKYRGNQKSFDIF